jgi:hypothetical protein
LQPVFERLVLGGVAPSLLFYKSTTEVPVILAIFIYFCANQGLLVASPVVVNVLAAGSVATAYSSKLNINVMSK